MGSLAQDGQLSRTVTVLFPPSGAHSPGAGGLPLSFPREPGALGGAHQGRFSLPRTHLLCVLTAVWLPTRESTQNSERYPDTRLGGLLLGSPDTARQRG